MPSTKGLSSKVHENFGVDEYTVTWNDKDIDDQMNGYLNLEIVFGGKRKKGIFSFTDVTGLTFGETKMDEGGFIGVTHLDPSGTKYTDEFVITKINIDEVRGGKGRTVHIEMEGKDSRNFDKTFKSKGYPETSFSKAMTTHLDENGNEKIKVIAPEEEDDINMVIPADISFQEFMEKEGNEKGYDLVTDKETSYLVHRSHRPFDKLQSSGLVYQVDSDAGSLDRILQYEIGPTNMEAYVDGVGGTETSIDPVTANAKKNVKDGQNVDATGYEPEYTQEQISQRGYKQFKGTGEAHHEFSHMNNAQLATIWVPGTNSNKVGFTIEANFPEPRHTSSGEYDKNTSGDWEVYYVRDKVFNGTFVQELGLRRPPRK